MPHMNCADIDTCDDCQDRHSRDDDYNCDDEYSDPDDCGFDNCCCSLIRSYDYKPSPVFHGTGPLFLGPEIEIETPIDRTRRCAEIARSHLGSLGYLKSDSSLDHGFEIVTHPMSYAWAMARFPWSMLTRLRDQGCFTTANTGIHVHVSRAGFASPCHTYRWMKFIHRNQSPVTAIARRSSPQWAAFTEQDRRAAREYAKGAPGERYRAINPNNPDTFELRIFASSLDPAQVRATLAFTAASVEYARDLTCRQIAHHDGWTWPAFTDWLTHRPEYQPLNRQAEALSCAC